MAPELILMNGKVYSITLDGKEIHGEAVAVKDGLIFDVGSNEDIKNLADENTEIVDCKGNTILPGLTDGHCHPAIAGAAAMAADLYGVYREEGQTSDDVIEILMERLRKHLEEHPDDKVVRGIGWVYSIFATANDRMPNRHDIDRICADRPVILESFCQHNIWVNTKAIEVAGVDANTPDPVTGKIYREENGYPEGVFADPEAMLLIKENVPGYELSVEEYKECLRWYQREGANKYGVTFVQDCMCNDTAREAYRQMAEDGELTIRLRGVYHLEPSRYEEQMPEFIERKGRDNVKDDFQINTVKMFAEGDFSFIDGYLPEYCEENNLPSDYNPDLYWEDDVFVEYATKAMDAGFNVHVHAMGDKSVVQTAECLAKAQHNSGKKPGNIIAHLMVTPDETAELMGREEIIACCQPSWFMLEDDVMVVVSEVGEEKGLKSYPYRKFRDNGVRVAFGTDFPVTPPPCTMHEIGTAMTRTVNEGYFSYEKYKGQILGDEKPATLAEAIQSISINGAFELKGDAYTGSIEKGKSAELVVLDSDIEATDPKDIHKIRIAQTYFKGKKVYDSTAN